MLLDDSSILPYGMDASRKFPDAALRPRSPLRPRPPSLSLPSVPLQQTFDPGSAHGLSGGPVSEATPRRTSAGNLRNTTHRPANPTSTQDTPRAGTPESTDHAARDATATNIHNNKNVPFLDSVNRELGPVSPHRSSPRSIPTVPSSAICGTSSGRRQGVVFDENFPSSLDSTSSSPLAKPSPTRPRGHTVDDAWRQDPSGLRSENSGHRVGSASSSASIRSTPPQDEALRGPPLPKRSPVLDPTGYSSVFPARPTDLQIQIAGIYKEKKGHARAKLMKRVSRPTSPMMSPLPSLDSLPLPVPTEDANKILLLMKTLCGRMRGEVAYQNEAGGPWHSGLCYIEEDKGSLMFDSDDSGPPHVAVIQDLRGSRVLPVERPGMDRQCLEIVNSQSGVEVLLWPRVPEELDLWLAALLCWQQVRPTAVRAHNYSQSTAPTSQSRPELMRRGSSVTTSSGSIIKVSRVALWDKGIAHTPRAIFKRASRRDLRSSQTSWRKVSCILSDDGELKLITESYMTVLSIISLSQLSRCAIQKLDKSVLDEEYCLAIFPIYASTANQLSIFRPVFMSLDHRVLFEVWLVLLRAFTVPEIYAVDRKSDDQILEITDFETDLPDEAFRVEKTIKLRVIEAKIGRPTSPHAALDRHGKDDHDAIAGNYLAEVMLDGEVRARTITKSDTRNPFWRDDCEFSDLPANLPYVSVILKRIDGNLDSMTHQLQASLGLPRTGNLVEVSCGSMDIPLHQLERGKDHERWLQICDDRQRHTGTMLCKVRHEEVVVFVAKDYQPLSELLHKFSSGLTLRIAESLPGQLRRLAEILLNIFQVSNTSSDWIMVLVEDEIDGIGQQTHERIIRFSRGLKSSESLDVSNAQEREALRDMGKSLAGEANLLFRGNSLLTHALEFHMRRVGKEYIEEILGDKIFEISEINPDCEVDPGRLPLGEDIGHHWEQLLQFTNEIWDCIAKSANKFPPELRHILKYIRAAAEDRYGDFLRTVAFTSVSSFLFLRFICPAILNPKLFGLLRDYPRPRAQRTLTLIAKALQALANLTSIGKKEVWMVPMNRFLASRRQTLKDFIDDVCAIPAERSSCILPASYSTPITILGRLSPLAREGFPSLPYLIDHARNFACLVKMWVDNQPLSSGVAENRYEGDLMEFHASCVSLQQRADGCMARMDAVRSAENENASQPTDSDMALVDGIESFSLAGSVHATSRKSAANSVLADHERRPGSPDRSSIEDDRGGHGVPAHRSSEKWTSGLLQALSGSGDQSERKHHYHQYGSLKSLRSGKNAKKFLSGLLRKIDRTGGAEASGFSAGHTSSSLQGSGESGEHKSGSTTPTGGLMRGRDKEKGRSTFAGLADAWKEFDAHSKS